MVGYATIYTMFPVFSLVLDKDLDSKQAMMYPELYKDLTKGRSLTYKTFFVWILISLYQGERCARNRVNRLSTSARLTGNFYQRRYFIKGTY